MENNLFDRDLLSVQKARNLAAAARQAYKTYSTFSQEKVDRIIKAMADAAVNHSENLAELAVKETGYGNKEDKTAKNMFASRNIYESIKDLKTVGVINRDYKNKIIEIAHPMGVILGITPTTNPTSTVIFKSLISAKSRNAIIFSPHPHAVLCSKEAARVMGEAAESAGAPANLISCLDIVTLEGSKELMASPDVSLILATGGTNMVKAAHSYGKPAIGVGPGNTPVYVDRSANLLKAASDIISSKTFDNGVICASEQAIVVHKDIDSQFRSVLKNLKAYFLSEEEIKKVSPVLVKGGVMNADMVGQTPKVIAQAVGINIESSVKLLIAPLYGVGPDYPLSREILSTVLSYYVEDNWISACHRCIELLNFGGVGHTLVIHASDEEVVTAFAHEKPVFRILINTPASQGAIGLTTSLTPSLTLSTGTWGGGISSDNISASDLINIKRVAYEVNSINTASSSDISGNTQIKKDIVESIVRKVVENLNLK